MKPSSPSPPAVGRDRRLSPGASAGARSTAGRRGARARRSPPQGGVDALIEEFREGPRQGREGRSACRGPRLVQRGGSRLQLGAGVDGRAQRRETSASSPTDRRGIAPRHRRRPRGLPGDPVHGQIRTSSSTWNGEDDGPSNASARQRPPVRPERTCALRRGAHAEAGELGRRRLRTAEEVDAMFNFIMWVNYIFAAIIGGDDGGVLREVPPPARRSRRPVDHPQHAPRDLLERRPDDPRGDHVLGRLRPSWTSARRRPTR